MTENRHDDAAGLITPREFAQVAELLKRIAGINLNPGKRAMVSGRLNKWLNALGYRSIGSYCAALAEPDNADEQDEFISALTTNMTRFNRESHHFTHLTEKVLPELLRTARGGGRARIWSAGCSTGEEAYDLAFRVLQACPDAKKTRSPDSGHRYRQIRAGSSAGRTLSRGDPGAASGRAGQAVLRP
ncbi:hypothetical protein DDZ14_14765 [Maritimibacter sp. 55A14]|nr:CheR family methyltransferase [Maritimibacter sp. 55A14]PWE30554.1 hypothetical protein DDZ14_14765 [Maritimibacter sp. 55A14]